MRERTRVRVCALLMSLLVGVLLPMHAFAQGGYGPMPVPPPQQTPLPERPQEPDPALAEARSARPNPALMAVDLLIMRPLGFVGAAVGAVLFLPAALITAPMGRESIETAKETFITVPSNEVFKRPLGKF
jgi:hypothetical protein